MKKGFFLLWATLLLTGCFPWEDGAESEVTGNYYVRGNSRFENVHLGYEDSQHGRIGLISAPITAVGHNEDYIIARRGGTKDQHYYILKVVKSGVHSDAEKNIIGPLEKAAFDTKLQELGINSLEFNKEYKDK